MERQITVDTAQDRALRQLEFEAMDRDQQEKDANRNRENQGFTQVYTLGWKRLQELMKTHPSAARVYAFFAQHISGPTGSVTVTQGFIAEELKMHRRTVMRLTRELEEAKVIVRIKVGVGVYAYCLKPEEVWASFNDSKKTAAFHTKTLVKKTDNKQVKRKLMLMMEE